MKKVFKIVGIAIGVIVALIGAIVALDAITSPEFRIGSGCDE